MYLSHLLTLYLLDLRGPKSTPNNGKSPFYSVLRSIGLILGCFILRSFQLSDRSQDIGPHICATDSEIEPHFIHHNTSLPMGVGRYLGDYLDTSWGCQQQTMTMIERRRRVQVYTQHLTPQGSIKYTGIATLDEGHYVLVGELARTRELECALEWTLEMDDVVGVSSPQSWSMVLSAYRMVAKDYIVWGKELEAQFNKRMILNALTSW